MGDWNRWAVTALAVAAALVVVVLVFSGATATSAVSSGEVAWGDSASGTPASGDSASACTAFVVRNFRSGTSSNLAVVDLPTGTSTSVGELGYWVNALGYSSRQGLAYGLADGDRRGRFGEGPHAITLDEHGRAEDLGPLGEVGSKRAAGSLIADATAGAIRGNRWYVKKHSTLYTVDINPESHDYLKVTGSLSLRPASLAAWVDDFAFSPEDGLLYGVAAFSYGHGAVMRIDPASGVVESVDLPRLRSVTSFGAVVFGPDGALYATANRIGVRSVLLKIDLDGSGQVTEIASGRPLASSDAAGCLSPPVPPSPTTPPSPSTPPPSTTPTSPPPEPSTTPPSPTTTPPPPSSTAASPPTPPPPVVSDPPRNRVPEELPPPATPPPPATVAPSSTMPPSSAPSSSSPSSPSSTRARVKPTPPPPATRRDHQTEEKRRWSLTVLVLILGGGAAATHLRRSR